MSEQGRKYDGGKLRYDLIPVLALEETTKVVTKGAEKYDDENWKLVPEGRRRYLAAAMRHIQQWRKGEIYDEEMGTHHIANAISNLMFILEKELRGWKDSSEDSSRDISQEELKEYVEGIIPENVFKGEVQSRVQKLWYPPVKDGENPWIEWNRGEFPDSLTGTEFIEFLCESERDQREYRYPTIFLSNDVYWTNQGIGSDIVAYKVVS